MRASVLSAAEPFVGLRPFEKSDTHLFFGRDVQVNELLTRLRTQRFVVVMGTSGSGKSSLIRAGLIPALEGGFIPTVGGEWRIAVLRPGGNPIGNLAAALAHTCLPAAAGDELITQQAILESILRRGSLGLIDAIRESSLSERASLLVVVDQFEELFRFKTAVNDSGAADHAAAFVKLLLQAVRQQDQPVHVVLTMRSEFLGDCAQFPELPEFINEGLYLIPRLNRDQLAEAIIGPAAVAGARVSPSLVQRLLNDVGDDPDQLPVLQHALMRIWSRLQRTPAGGELLLEHYDAIHGLNEALSDHADEAYGELDERQRLIAEKIFKALTERGHDGRDVRRPTRLDDLCRLAHASIDEVVAVLDIFRREGRCFVVPSGDQPLSPGVFIDISHESLIRKWTRLRDWVNEEAEDRKLFLRLADSAAAHAAGAEPLWRHPQLGLALHWRARFRPTEAWAGRHGRDLSPSIAFLEASDKAQHTEDRRATVRRYGWIVAIAALLSLAGIAWEIYDEFLHARREAAAAGEREALSNALGEAKLRKTQEDLALQKLVFDSTTGAAAARAELIKAAAAAETDKRRSTEAERQRLILQFNRTSNPEGSEVGTLVALHAFHRAQLTGQPDILDRTLKDLRGHLALFGEQISQDNLPGPVTRMGGPTESRVVVAGTATTFTAWDLGSATLGRLQNPLRDTGAMTSPMAVSGSGRFVAWTSRTPGATPSWRLSLWDSRSRQVLSETDPKFRAVRMVVPAENEPTVLLTGDEGTDLLSFETKESTRLSDRRIDRAAFSANDRVLATAGEDGLRVWMLAPFRSVSGTDIPAAPGKAPGKAPAAPVTLMAVSSKGSYVAAAIGNLAWVWKLPSDDGPAGARPTVRFAVDGPTERVTDLSFSPDEQIIAAASSSGRVLMQDTEPETRSTLSRPDRTAFSLPSPVDHVVFGTNNQLLAAAARDGSVRIWSRPPRSPSWHEIGRLFLRTRAQSLAFVSAPDNENEPAILTGEDSGAIRLWKLTESAVSDLPGSALAELACSRLKRPLKGDEWEAYFGTERYESPCPGLPLHPLEFLKLQIIHARNGNAGAAREAFRRTATLDQLTASQLVAAAVVQAEAGNRFEARELFQAAVRAAGSGDGNRPAKARINNTVCWHGAIRDFANDVLPACRTAVELAQEDVRYMYRDSLGVAQALRGEREPALEAFQEYVAKAKTRSREEALISRRERWIAALKNQGNPFRQDKQRVLEELQNESSRPWDPELGSPPTGNTSRRPVTQ